MNRTQEGVVRFKNEKYSSESNQTQKKYLEIYAVPENALVIDLSKIQEITLKQKQTAFNCSYSLKPCQNADYLVFYNRGENKYVICIEVKQRPISTELESKMTNQLTGGLCFINYCQSLINNFWNQEFLYDYQPHYIGMVERGLNKKSSPYSAQEVNIESQAFPTTPANFRHVYFNDDLNFKYLTPP